MKSFSSVFTYRGYQQEAHDCILAEVSNGVRSLLVQQDTGTGKSIEMIGLISHYLTQGKRVLLIVPKTDLVHQFIDYCDVLGISPGTFFNEGNNRLMSRLCIGTLDTLRSRVAGLIAAGHGFDYVFWDEAHHLKAKTWEKTFNILSSAVHILFTATPCRLDGKGFDGLVEKLLCVKNTRWFFDNGEEVNGVYLPYLSPFRVFSTPNTFGDFRKVKGDYDLSQQTEFYGQNTIAGNIVKTYLERCEGQKMIGFAPSVETSKDLVARYNAEYGSERFVHLDGTSPKGYRKDILEAFKNGDLLGLYNVDLFIEGMNAPSAAVCQIVRDTSSTAVHRQMCGRVLRPAFGKVATFLCHSKAMVTIGMPNANFSWSLKGVEKVISYELVCEHCGNVLLSDYRETSKTAYYRDGLDQFFIPCPNCQHETLVPKIKRPSGDRKKPTFDDSLGLEELTDINPIPSQINKLQFDVKVKGYKPQYAIYKMMETSGFTVSYCKDLCIAIGYKPSAAKYIMKVYDLIHFNPGLERYKFNARLSSLGVADRLHEPYFQIYEKLHGNKVCI